MAEKIAGIVYALLFITPLLFSVLFILKACFVDWPKRQNSVSLMARLTIVVPLISIVLFLIYILVVKFVFPSVSIPKFFNVLGIVLAITYINLFFGFFIGLGALGHGGISPSIVIRELYKLFFKK